jgi:DNA polymerase-3 subunit epsilon
VSGIGKIHGPGPELGCGIIVIDFETLTPAGRPLEPIEVAALALRHSDGRWHEQARFSALIRPPDDVPVTARCTALTGITAEMLAPARSAREVLGELDRRLGAPPYRLVAHRAATEGSLIRRQAEHCPNLAATALIDTIAMARAVAPGLASYRLDSVIAHYRIPPQPDRHRAMVDVELTTQIFTRLLADGVEARHWRDLESLDRVAGRAAATPLPPRGPAPYEAKVPAS